MQAMPVGAMLAVALPAGELAGLMKDEVEVAAVNAPGLTTVSGPLDAIQRLEGMLAGRGIGAHRLQTSHAFHSRMMEPILKPFRDEVARADLRVPQRPYISNISGTWITGAEARDPDYYARQLREPVRFSDGIRLLLAELEPVFVEVGPGQALTTLVQQHLSREATAVVVPSLGKSDGEGSDVRSQLQAVGRVWMSGIAVDWRGFHAHEDRRKVVLPSYPFERERYWVEPGVGVGAVDGSGHGDAPRGAYECFYAPSWKRSGPRPIDHAVTDGDDAACWLVFCDDCGLGDRLVDRLTGAGRRVVAVSPGPSFGIRPGARCTLRPDCPDDYVALMSALRDRGLSPDRIFHAWNVTRPTGDATGDDFDAMQRRGFYSLLFLAQALVRHGIDREITIVAVATATQRVIGDELLRPEKTTVLGPCRTIPQELPGVTCRYVDVPLPEGGGWSERTIDDLLGETAAPPAESVVAYRGAYRWVQCFETVRLDAAEPPSRLREGGTYLVTGGLGAIGLLVAGQLAEQTRARIVLTGRSPFPPREDWGAWLAAHGEEDEVSRKIQTLQAIEDIGGEVLVLSADVADEAQMRAVMVEVERNFGALHGVFHCAGATTADAFASIMDVTPALAEAHFRPKVRGLLVLQRVLPAEGLDFCMLMSSLSAVLGGLGFLPYAAANIFMDAFADAHAGPGGVPWISVDWDGWRLDEDDEDREPREAALSPEAGLEALTRILGGRVGPQVVVSTRDLDERLRQWVELADVGADAAEGEGEVDARHLRPELRTEYRAPTTEIETRLAELWQRLLGLDHVGVDDNFFELGGHSLLAIQLTARLRELFRVEVSAGVVLAAPTVAQLAAEVDHASESASRTQTTIERMLTHVEQMSDEEIRALLAEPEATPEVPAGDS